MKKNQIQILELQSTITEMKNSLEELNNIIKQAEKRIRELSDRSTEIIQWEKEKEKLVDKNEQSLRDLWVTIKCANVMGVPGEQGERNKEK